MNLRDTPCPRCGCYLAKHFECDCGAVHDDHCANCGRWVSLPAEEHTELGPYDVRCEVGAIMHEHSAKERGSRIVQYIQAFLQSGKGPPN